MDVSSEGKLVRLAKSLGKVVGEAPLEEDLERLALGVHVQRDGAPPLALAASAYHDGVVAMYLEPDTAVAAMSAARALVHDRADDLSAGRVLTLLAGAKGARSVRGGTGAYALVDPKAVELPTWVTVFAVGAPPPVCNWEKATLDEVRLYVPDFVTRFPKPRKAKDASPSKPSSSGPRTVIRRR